MHGAEERANQLSWGERKLPSGEYLSNVTFSFEMPQPQMTFLPQCTMHDPVLPLKSHMSVQKGEKKILCTIHLSGCSGYVCTIFWQFIEGE